MCGEKNQRCEQDKNEDVVHVANVMLKVEIKVNNLVDTHKVSSAEYFSGAARQKHHVANGE